MPSIVTGGYAPPGTYTQTFFGTPPTVPAVPPLVPMFIGTGSEILVQTNLPIVRGSSSSVDQQIVHEDETGRSVVNIAPSGLITLGAFDGTSNKFQVRNYPIVNGDGSGTTTTDTSTILVTINGQSTVVLGIDGAKGLVEISDYPIDTDQVLCTYYFKRTDTQVTDNVSDQVTATDAVIDGSIGQNYTFVTGSTDTLKLAVDGLPQVTVVFPAGTFTAAVVAATINGTAGIGTLVASTFVNNLGLMCVRLTADKSITIGDGTANGVLGFVGNATTTRNRVFYVFNGPIVTGDNGGVTSTNPSDVMVLVDNVAVVPTSVNGRTRAVTLPFAPAAGSVVTIQYYFNAWQDTFDYLANTGVIEITRAAVTANSNGAGVYVQGSDYVLKNDSILWGTASLVSSGLHTEGYTTFGTSQITATLIDNQMFMAECPRYVDTSGTVAVASRNQFVLPHQPTTGNGRNSPLGATDYNIIANGRMDLPTDQPDLVIAYWGFDLSDAISRGSVTVTKVDSDTSVVTLASEVPEGATVYATFYYNTLTDQAWIGSSRGYTVTVSAAGTSGVGTYSVTNGNNLPVYGVTFLGKGAALTGVTVNFPSGSEFLSDARLEGGTPTLETVSVQFASTDATPAHYTFPNPETYYTVGGQSSNLRVTIDGVAGSTGGVSGIPLQYPSGGTRAGAFASVVSNQAPYTAASGETTYDLTSGVNDTVSLLVDHTSFTASVGTSLGADLTDFRDAINTAAMATNPYLDSAGSFSSGYTVVATNYDRITLHYTGLASLASGNQTITLTPATYATAALLAAQVNTQLATINGLGGLNAVVTCAATADSKLRFTLATSLAKSTYSIAVGNMAPADTVTIGAVTYTFVALLAAPFDVLVGGTAALSAANLVSAITADPAGSGVAYGVGTTAHPLVTATFGVAGPPATAIVTAKNPGAAANLIATTTVAANGSFTGLTLTGGDDSGYLEFVTNIVPARDFCTVTGLDTASATNGGQTKLYQGPIAWVYSVTMPSTRKPYDRMVLRNRIFPGAGSMTPHNPLSQCVLYSQGGNGSNLAGIPVGMYGEAEIGGSVMGPSVYGFVGWASGQATAYGDARDGQPNVIFYDGTGTAAANNVFKFTVNSTLVTVVFTSSGAGTNTALGPSTLATSVIGTINAALTAAGLSGISAVQEGAAIRLYGTGTTYLSNTAQIIMGNGTANTTLGFTDGEVSGAMGITAHQMASALMSHNANADFVALMLTPGTNTVGYFGAKALAWTVTDADGSVYTTMQSRTTGTSSSFLFASATTADALRTGTNLGITAGNGSAGEATKDGFFVISSDPTSGSGSANTSVFNPANKGQDGYVGQTYVDDVTGLTFTVLPRAGGLLYPTGATATLTFRSSTTIVTDANIPTLAIPGLELTVANTAGCKTGDTARVETFKRGGSEPAIGEIYYVSYNYTKTDFSSKLFSRITDVVNEYGVVSPDNPLSLAAYMAFLNGSSVIGCKQVPKTTGSATASETAYMAAIEASAGQSLPGYVAPAVIVPLTPATQSLVRYTAIHCDVQSSIRYKAERTAIFGFASGTRTDVALGIAAVAGDTRVRVVYPDIASISLTNELGITKTYLIDGRYLAAAVAAATTAPSIDPATPWESRQLTGFTSLNRRLDAVTMNQLAVGGITVLENRPPFVRIRHGLTTDMTNILTKTPTVIQISDEMQKRLRATCDPFIGAKFLPQLLGQIEGRIAETFKQAVQEQLITSFTNISVTTDPTDPTAIIVEAFYQPVFPLLYIQITLRVSSSG